MTFVSLLKDKLRSISFTHLLLGGILLILFFGLFKREIFIWRIMNWPELRQKDKTVNYPCKTEVTNPDYTKAWSDTFEKCGLTPSWTDGRLSDYILRRQQCKFEGELPPRTISVDSTCQKTEKERWFFAFGKYWFMPEQLVNATASLTNKVKGNLQQAAPDPVLVIIIAIIIGIGWYIGLIPQFVSWLHRQIKKKL